MRAGTFYDSSEKNEGGENLKVKVVQATKIEKFENEVNTAIENLIKEGFGISDIKYSTAPLSSGLSINFTAMIIYN